MSERAQTGSIDSGVLSYTEAPPSLAPHFPGFVVREERGIGGVVRVLPELRASVQIMLGDGYWLRGKEADARWVQCPRIAIWAPSFSWRYGHVRDTVKAFAFALSPSAFCALAEAPATETVNSIIDLEQKNPAFARSIAPLPGELFEDWMARIEPALAAFAANLPKPESNEAVLRALATTSANAIERAAAAAGVSMRQFRRVFADSFGASPKAYQRAMRVDRMIRQLHPRPWETDIFADEPIPFADQPHAIREFRALTGMTPAAYRAAKRAGDRTLRSIPVEGVDPPDGAET